MRPIEFLTELVTKVKPNINSVEVHPQLSNNGHPVDGVLVGASFIVALQSSLQGCGVTVFFFFFFFFLFTEILPIDDFFFQIGEDLLFLFFNHQI
jgi:hypothetical protein